jgi:hypothetical protein
MRGESPSPQLVQEFLANSFTISIVRKMGPAGTLKCIRNFIKDLDLTAISKTDASNYTATLNEQTKVFQQVLPSGARHWGIARKCLNLFFRDALYNFYLREQYGLIRFEEHLEIPLDSRVGKRLRCESEGFELPRWTTVKGLKHEESNKFQDVAAAVAKRCGTRRVHLDLVYWRGED